MGGLVNQMQGGSPAAVGNTGNMNWNLGQQVQKNQNTNFSQFLQNQMPNAQATIAQAQLKQATDQGIANQMAMAAGARGANAGTAQRLAAQGMAGSGQVAAQQSGLLAAQQEQQMQQNALQYQNMNNNYATSLYGLANQRDMGIAGVDENNQKMKAAGTQAALQDGANFGAGIAKLAGL